MINSVLGFIASFKSAAINLLNGLDTKSDSILSAVSGMASPPPINMADLLFTTAYTATTATIDVVGAGYCIFLSSNCTCDAPKSIKIYLDSASTYIEFAGANGTAALSALTNIFSYPIRFENRLKFTATGTYASLHVIYTLDA